MERLKKWGVIIVPGMVGLVILLYAMWEVIKPREPVVEIIKNEQRVNNEIVVDVAGAVEKPGIYKLTSGGRVGDALVAAGGLAVDADREWISKNLNLAEAVKDGGKIYIPENQRISASDKQNTRSVSESEKSDNQKDGKVNINTASQGELETLWGIGEARAKMIMESRPYGSSEELVSKAKIPQSVYEQIKTYITVY